MSTNEHVLVVGNAQQQETPYVYSDIYEAPSHLRIIRSARTSLAQINKIVEDAYAHMLGPEEGIRETSIPDFGGAKNRFQESHKIEKGFWITKTEEGN